MILERHNESMVGSIEDNPAHNYAKALLDHQDFLKEAYTVIETLRTKRDSLQAATNYEPKINW